MHEPQYIRPWNLVFFLALILCIACGQDSDESVSRQADSFGSEPPQAAVEGFILRTGEGESLLNGIVVKASPATGTEGSILVEQTFPPGSTIGLTHS